MVAERGRWRDLVIFQTAGFLEEEKTQAQSAKPVSLIQRFCWNATAAALRRSGNFSKGTRVAKDTLLTGCCLLKLARLQTQFS